MKKFIVIFLALMVCFAFMPHSSEARGFGGGRSFGTSHTGTYHSNFTRPSGKVTRNFGTTSHRGPFGGRLMSHAAAFGIGALVGHMFHPFGGYHGGGTYGFSFLGILLDIVIILVIIRLIKGIVKRRRY